MQQFLHVLHVQNAEILRLQDMQTHLYSLTSMLVTLVTRLHSVLVTSKLTDQSYLA